MLHHLSQTLCLFSIQSLKDQTLTQGIRRIVAVTGQEAADAIKEGEAIANQLAAAQKLEGQQLEKEVAALKQVRICYATADG